MRHMHGSILLIAALLSCFSAQAQTQPENFHIVTPDLLRGARVTDQSQADYLINSQHVQTVIDLQGGDLTDPRMNKLTNDAWEQKDLPKLEAGETPTEIATEKNELEKAGLNPSGFQNPALDSIADVTPAEATKITSILDELADPKTPRPIYVHCAHGADRTGLIIALYRVFVQGWAPQKAHDEMKAMGHNFFHQIFTHDMDQYFWHAVKLVNDSQHFSHKVADADIKNDLQIVWDKVLQALPFTHCPGDGPPEAPTPP